MTLTFSKIVSKQIPHDFSADWAFLTKSIASFDELLLGPNLFVRFFAHLGVCPDDEAALLGEITGEFELVFFCGVLTFSLSFTGSSCMFRQLLPNLHIPLKLNLQTRLL